MFLIIEFIVFTDLLSLLSAKHFYCEVSAKGRGIAPFGHRRIKTS